MLSLGLKAHELAAVTGATESSVRNWITGSPSLGPRPRWPSTMLRAVLKTLLDGVWSPSVPRAG